MNRDYKMRLLVVIINYKTPDLVIGALESLVAELDPLIDRTIVVDNYSDDGSTQKIEAVIKDKNWQNRVELIQSPVNGGFSAGNNIGIKASEADYYLLLNSDAYVHKDAVKIMIDTLRSDQGIGIVGPSLEWENGEQQVSCFNNMTPLGEFVRTANTGIVTKLFRSIGIKAIARNMASEISVPDWISFACVMLRKEVINDIGLMDENYFMYREDNDYCRRAKNKNWQITYCPLARVVHLNQGFSHQRIQRMPDFYHRSRSYYFIKFYGRIGLLLANICWWLGRLFSKIREILSSKKSNVHHKTYMDIWKGFWQ